MDNEDRLVTINDMANYIGCSTRSIRRYVKAGMPVIKIGGLWRFDYDEVISWLRKMQETGEVEA